MSILVAYASKYGATQGIAERIAATLGAAGQEAELRPVGAVDDPTGYDAFVVGSAVYDRHWRKDAWEWVLRNRTVLASRPVWLFSSGPLGPVTTDAQGRDRRLAAEPEEITEFRDVIAPEDHRVFFGALDPSSSESVNERSGSSRRFVPPCLRATSATGPRSRPGRVASPATWRSCAWDDAEAWVPSWPNNGPSYMEPVSSAQIGKWRM